MTRVLGIDPGKNGALTLIDSDDWSMVVVDMPLEPGLANRDAVSPTGVARLITSLAPDYTFCEAVWSSPQMGIASSFAFGRSLGIVLGASAARSMLTMVKPALWKGMTGTPKDKNQARRRAQELFPCAYDLFKRVKDDGRSESAILAMYGLLSMKMPPPRPLTLKEIP